MRFKRCDNCGKINPRIFDNNPRLCGECAKPLGFYRAINDEMLTKMNIGTNGKIGLWKLRFPIVIKWRGWWTL